MLVSVDDFDLTINIPNTDETPVINRLTGFIAKYEPEYLTQLLGATLYADFKAGLEEDPIPTKWQSLKDNISVEQIASFVYFYWVRKNNSFLSGNNIIVKPKTENAENISPIFDQVNVWNEMVDSSFKTVKFIQENNVDYGNYYLPDMQRWYYYNHFCHSLPDIFYKQNYHVI